ncbi:hypothetical protein LCGC14_1599480 [marine sediment metagenome]|uniref:Putative exodeoxyribonuclease 8 PDDEXK-like domain-containing protein n=1 Tax=marine sediment metagenome TaxID=412755 RepID=A0A0F9KSB3_9ZZZZ
MLTVENYHSIDSNKKYLSASQYKDFCGSAGLLGCEAKAMAKIDGTWIEEPTPAMVVSSYVDAHFSSTLHIFKGKHPEIFRKDNGDLKADFKKMDIVIARIERDEYFMKYMSGEIQVIMTGKMLGCEWKIAIDSFLKGVAIVDLKVMKSLNDSFWVKDLGHTSFVVFYGYDIQAAIYQGVVKANTGEVLPFFIAGASKEGEPDIEIVGIDNRTIKNANIEMKANVKRILKLKSGEVEPDKCGVCDYCRSIKVLSKPIHYSELGRKI